MGRGRSWAALAFGDGWWAGGLESWVQAGDLTLVGVPLPSPTPNPQRAGPVLAMRPQQAPVSGKVFIQRDYSSGTRCQFQTKFPAELENRVRRLTPRASSGRGRALQGREGSMTPAPLSVSRLWGGAGKEGALVRRGSLSKTWCLEEDEKAQVPGVMTV